MSVSDRARLSHLAGVVEWRVKRHRRNRHDAEHERDLSGPMVLAGPAPDLPKLAGAPR